MGVGAEEWGGGHRCQSITSEEEIPITNREASSKIKAATKLQAIQRGKSTRQEMQAGRGKFAGRGRGRGRGGPEIPNRGAMRGGRGGPRGMPSRGAMRGAAVAPANAKSRCNAWRPWWSQRNARPGAMRGGRGGPRGMPNRGAMRGGRGGVRGRGSGK